MKVYIYCVIILSVLAFSKAFSQEENKIGFHLELDCSIKVAKKENNGGGLRFFVTPSYKIGDNTSVGIGAGVKLFIYCEPTEFGYRDELANSFPLYVNTMHKFKANGITPFVECKLGYAFFKRDYSWKISSPLSEEVEAQVSERGGLFFSPSIGILFPKKNKRYLSASFAYCLDIFSGKGTHVQLNEVTKYTADLHAIAVRIGYIF